MDEPRDSPLHLPDAPPAAAPWDPAPPAVAGSPVGEHCSSWHGGLETPCRRGQVNLKQQRLIRLLSAALKLPVPLVATAREANAWLARHWRRWMEQELWPGPASRVM